jgi:hypothetical protein
MLRLYPVKPIIPILESFLSVIAQFMLRYFLILALIIAMWSSASSVDFSNGRDVFHRFDV